MKKIFVLLAIIIFSSPVFAFELPAGKTINKTAVENGIINYTEKIKANPNNEDAYINRAFLSFLLNDISSAILDYDKLISINPNNEEFYLNRGYLKHISNKRDEALKDYDMALKINPNYAFAHNNRGVVLHELGRNSESLTALDTAIKINPNYADAYYNRGNLKTRNNNNQEALEDFNTAISLNPSDSASYNNRGVVKRKLNYNVGALSDFSIAIKLDPSDITAFANRGRLKKRYFDSEGAEEDFKTAIAVAEESPTLIKQVETQAVINRIQKETNSTKPVLRESKPVQSQIQRIAYKQDNSSPTVKATVLKVDPKSTLNETVPIAKTNTNPTIETKPVINPELAECYYIRALQKYILQNRESALKDFDMAIKHNPKYAEAYYYRAAIKRDYNDEGFVEDYKKALELDPALKNVADADVLMILKI